MGGSNPTLSYGESKIKAARRNSYKLKLQIEGYVNAKVGMKVNLSDKKLGKINDLLVSKVKYRLNANKDIVEITLRKE